MEQNGNIRDRIHLRAKDFINLYERIAISLKEAPHKICKSIPLFMIRESLSYFGRLEEFEKCQLIKEFADNNPRRITKITKDEWLNNAGL